MGLLKSLFKSEIATEANKLFTQRVATDYARSLQNLMLFANSEINQALPTINPDGVDYYQSFKTIGAVYETTDLISKKVIGSPWVFYKVKDKKKLQQSKRIEKSDPVQAYILKLQAVEEVDSLGLTQLLANPNPYQTGDQWLWTVCLSYLLSGNTYIHGNMVGKRAKELYCFPNMTIATDIDDLLDPIRGFILDNTAQKRFEKEEIYHIKTGNPAHVDKTMQYLYGVSPLRAYLEPMRTIKESKKQSSKQAKNGGVFGILSPKDKEDQFSKEQKEQLKEKIKHARESNDEMARVFPSSISLLWQSIGLPIGDLKLLELVSANEEDIYRAYHVPLQFHNQKASTSNNQNTAVKQLVYDAVKPNCDAISDALTRFLGPAYGVDMIELDYTQLPEMAVNMKEVAAYLVPLIEAGIITPDEARNALKFGETGLDYMKEYYVATGRTTLKRVFEGEVMPPVNPVS